MGYTAPDPQQFSGMEQAYSYMAPLAAAQITMPAFVFSGPCTQISRIVYMNQCNPGQIMTVAATWLKVAEKYLAAFDKFKERTDGLPAEDWQGEDRSSFDGKADKVGAQLQIVAAFAMQIGISLFAIASMLAVMVPLMLASAASLFAFAMAYLIIRAIPNPISAIVAENVRIAATTTGMNCLVALETLDKAITVAAQGLAAYIGANMVGTWGAMASKGVLISPVDTLGSTGFSLLQGLSQMALRNLMAPGRTGTGTIGKISPKFDGMLAKANPFMTGFAGTQGLYNIGNNAAGDVDPDGENKMTEAGIEVVGLDFIPNTFEDQARGDGDKPLDWSTGEVDETVGEE